MRNVWKPKQQSDIIVNIFKRKQSTLKLEFLYPAKGPSTLTANKCFKQAKKTNKQNWDSSSPVEKHYMKY